MCVVVSGVVYVCGSEWCGVCVVVSGFCVHVVYVYGSEWCGVRVVYVCGSEWCSVRVVYVW